MFSKPTPFRLRRSAPKPDLHPATPTPSALRTSGCAPHSLRSCLPRRAEYATRNHSTRRTKQETGYWRQRPGKGNKERITLSTPKIQHCCGDNLKIGIIPDPPVVLGCEIGFGVTSSQSQILPGDAAEKDLLDMPQPWPGRSE